MKVLFDERSARRAIAATQQSYLAAIDHGDLRGMLSTFTRDAVLEAHGKRFTGHFEIQQGLTQMKQRPRAAGRAPKPSFIRHELGASAVEFDGLRSARVSAEFEVSTAEGPDHRGRYLDHFVEADGRWLIARRVIVIDWARSSSPMVPHQRVARVRTKPVPVSRLRPAVAGVPRRRVAG